MIQDNINPPYSPEILETILCPISLMPFEDAQIVDCFDGLPGHSFSRESVITIFGNVIEKKCEKPGPCPLCRRNVSTYSPNFSLQQVVDAILKTNPALKNIDYTREIVKKVVDTILKVALTPDQIDSLCETVRKKVTVVQEDYPFVKSEFTVECDSEKGAGEFFIALRDTQDSDIKPNRIGLIYFRRDPSKNPPLLSVGIYLPAGDDSSIQTAFSFLAKQNIKFELLNKFNLLLKTTDIKEFYRGLNFIRSNNTFDSTAIKTLDHLMERME